MKLTRREFAGLTLAAAASAALSTTPALAGSARKGTLSGRRGYTASGTVKVKKEGGKTKVVLNTVGTRSLFCMLSKTSFVL